MSSSDSPQPKVSCEGCNGLGVKLAPAGVRKRRLHLEREFPLCPGAATASGCHGYAAGCTCAACARRDLGFGLRRGLLREERVVASLLETLAQSQQTLSTYRVATALKLSMFGTGRLLAALEGLALGEGRQLRRARIGRGAWTLG